MNTKKFQITLMLQFILIVMMASCSTTNTNDEPIEKDIVPTSMTWSIKIIGSDTNTPNGDGSGMIRCKASAENAIRYGFKIDDHPELENTTGVYEHSFKKNGINSYTVRISAYSSTGNIISISNIIEVSVLSEEEKKQDPKLVWSDEFDADGQVNTDTWFLKQFPPTMEVGSMPSNNIIQIELIMPMCLMGH